MQILAHRGWWIAAEEKNSKAAFVRAFEAGYGIETDLRDYGGKVVVAHDMPVSPDLMNFESLLELYKATCTNGVLALNIKADGLQALVAEALRRYEVDNVFVFDMAVPDALAYLRTPIKTFTRHSEYEPVPAFYLQAHGVWVDCFVSEWIDAEVIRNHAEAGKAVALVSPELHQRPHEKVWESWRECVYSNILLCTDFPAEADALFNARS